MIVGDFHVDELEVAGHSYEVLTARIVGTDKTASSAVAGGEPVIQERFY